MKTLIKDIFIIDPYQNINENFSIIIENHKIKKIVKKKDESEDFDLIIDGKGKVLFPGLIDMHTHLREPGYEYKEDILSASKAALNGGFTTITSFPNTNPVLNNLENLNKLKKLIQKKALIQILPIAAITKDLKGKNLVDFKTLKKNGVIAFTDDGKGVQNKEVLYEVMKLAKKLDILLLLHEEDEFLLQGGVIHKGVKSKELNLPGICGSVEDMMTARDILLAKETGARIHFCHVSTQISAKLIALAKEENISVTGEVSPHHLCFNDEMIRNIYDTNKKMNPPLRSKEDQEFLIEALKNGVIDTIATDHAPHSEDEKSKDFLNAPFGITGLETAVSLIFSKLVLNDKISFYKLVESFTKAPADILGLKYSPILEGEPLNFVIFNKEKEINLDKAFFYSKSKNFPLINEKLKGKIEYVFYKNEMYNLNINGVLN